MPTVGGTKNPDVEAITALLPDLVVMDKEENRVDDAKALQASGVTVHVTHVRAVPDVAPTLVGLAAALGLAEIPGPGIDRRRRRRRRATGRAWIPIWRRPWMTINGATYGSSILAAAGIVNIYEEAAEPYPTVTLEAAAGLRPTSCWPHPSRIPSPSATGPSSKRWHPWSSWTGRTCFGGAVGPRGPSPGCGSWRRAWPTNKHRGHRAPPRARPPPT